MTINLSDIKFLTIFMAISYILGIVCVFYNFEILMAFLFILLYRFIRGVSMKKLKKPFYFILGFLFVPVILSNLVAYILNSSDENMLVGYFALVYLIIH